MYALITRLLICSVFVFAQHILFGDSDHRDNQQKSLPVEPANFESASIITGETLSPPVELKNYQLVLEENFNGNKLDTKIWNYTDENKVRGFGLMLRSNVKVSDGTLQLQAKKTKDLAGNTTFSASMVGTERSLNQKYGYFEIRAKVNSQLGPHCAFWLLQHSVGIANKIPNPSIFGAEVDIFEYHRAAALETLYFGLHWNGYDFTNGSHRTESTFAHVPGINKGFHLFSLEWTPKEYIVYVDGIEKVRSAIAVSHTPEFVLLSMEVNGYGGDRFQMSDNIPDVFEVDYVKVYARKPSVTVYGDCDYYGWTSDSLKPGSYTSKQLLLLGIVNNEASSMEIPKGWTVTAFDKDNCKGDSVQLRSDSRCLINFDNKISSLRITKKI